MPVVLRRDGGTLRRPFLGLGIGEEQGLQDTVQYSARTEDGEEAEDEDEGVAELHADETHHVRIWVMDKEETEVEAEYRETEDERVLELRRGGDRITVSVTKNGYGMLIVADETGELERYYGFDMALDHAAEALGVSPDKVQPPEEASDMGM